MATTPTQSAIYEQIGIIRNKLVTVLGSTSAFDKAGAQAAVQDVLAAASHMLTELESLAFVPTGALQLLPSPQHLEIVSGQPFRQAFIAVGGTAPYTFNQTSGIVPQGMTFSPDGVLSGTTTVAPGNQFPFAFWVIDAAGAVAAASLGLVIK